MSRISRFMAIAILVMAVSPSCASINVQQAPEPDLPVYTTRVRVSQPSEDVIAQSATPAPAATMSQASVSVAVEPGLWTWVPKKDDTLGGLFYGSGYNKLPEFSDGYQGLLRFASQIRPRIKYPYHVLEGVTYALPVAPPNGELMVKQPQTRTASVQAPRARITAPAPLPLVIAPPAPPVQTAADQGELAQVRKELNETKGTLAETQGRLSTAEGELRKSLDRERGLAGRAATLEGDLEKVQEKFRELQGKYNAKPLMSVLLAILLLLIGAAVGAFVAYKRQQKNEEPVYNNEQVDTLKAELEAKDDKVKELEVKNRRLEAEASTDMTRSPHLFRLDLRGSGLLAANGLPRIWVPVDPYATKDPKNPMTRCAGDGNPVRLVAGIEDGMIHHLKTVRCAACRRAYPVKDDVPVTTEQHPAEAVIISRAS